MPGTLDQGLWAPRLRGDLQVFRATTGATVQGQGYQQWHKPRGCSMVYMFVVGGGGGGGGGFQAAATNARGGGAGGACSGLARFLCPAILLPDTLYVQIGNGGQGGVGGTSPTAGGAGVTSAVVTNPLAGAAQVTPNLICYSNQVAPGGGAAGAAGGGAVGGTVPTIAVTQPPNVWGQWFATVGIVGAAGGALGAVGVSVTAWGTIPISPGAGAGSIAASGADFAGGGVTATALTDAGGQLHYPTTAGSIASAGAAGGATAGGNGIERVTPFFNSGGAGGGTSDTGAGGQGGKGGIGCGGGGGGPGATAGNGGSGGDGIVIIGAW